MAEILFPIVLIWILAGLGWRAGSIVNMHVCPVCVGVSGTWILLLALRFAGVAIDPIVIAALMGGSVVGLAYQGEKRLAAGRSSVLWKVSFIPAGFLLVISVIENNFALAGAGALAACLIAYIFLYAHRGSKDTERQENGFVEKKLTKCC